MKLWQIFRVNYCDGRTNKTSDTWRKTIDVRCILSDYKVRQQEEYA